MTNQKIREYIILSFLLLWQSSLSAADCCPANRRTETIEKYESLKYGMFICFGMNTFTQSEYDEGDFPASKYAPPTVDVKQWIQTASKAGMKYAVLTAKHMSGFCLWDSNNYNYDVAASGNKTDVIAEFMDACREYGIMPGIYYCIIDPHNEKRVSWTDQISDDYYQLVKQHITELHSRYPGIRQQWLDIVIGKLNDAQRCELYNIIKSYSPDCLVLQNHGFKDGTVADPCAWPTDIINGERTYPPPAGHNPEIVFKGEKYHLPMEVCDTISQCWFGMPGDMPKSTRTLYRSYRDSVGRGANLLLNVPPARNGKIPDYHIKRLMELKAVIENPSILSAPPLNYDCAVSASNVFQNRPEYRPDFAIDDDLSTRWTTDAGTKSATLEMDLGQEKIFSSIKISEPFGKRIKKFEIKYKTDGKWMLLKSGTNIGKKYSCKFEPVKARYVRLEITDARESNFTKQNVIVMPGQKGLNEGPSISEFSIYSDNIKN